MENVISNSINEQLSSPSNKKEVTYINPLSKPIIQSCNKKLAKDTVNYDNITLLEKSKRDDFLQEMKEISKDLPDGKQQFEDLKSFTNGNMSYAEMRMRCG